MTFDLSSWAATARDDVAAFCQPLFRDAWPASFAEPNRYPLFSGGKRIRPLLAIAAFEALGGSDRSRVLPGATAVELVHTYSLVHDDLPCMDDDDERRGRPTVHIAWDEATAVLAGDALLTEAFSVLAGAPLSAEARIAMVAELSKAAGYQGMVGGQAGDIAAAGHDIDVETLLQVHRLKTGALIRAATLLGGIAGGATPTQLDTLCRVGEAIGLAFQLADDVLDADEDAGEGGPPSYVKLLGVEETTRRAEEIAQQAISAASTLPHPEALVALARFTVERDV